MIYDQAVPMLETDGEGRVTAMVVTRGESRTRIPVEPPARVPTNARVRFVVDGTGTTATMVVEPLEAPPS